MTSFSITNSKQQRAGLMVMPSISLPFLLLLSSVLTATAAGADSNLVEKGESAFYVRGASNSRDVRRTRLLQQSDGEGLPLYEYQLVMSATTSLSSQYGECTGWKEEQNPSNFTWYGLQVQLPDDAVTGNGQYFTDVTSFDEDDGIDQPYNETEPMIMLNYTFQSSESSPVVRINLNGDALWDSYKFDFAGVDSGAVKEHEKSFTVWCTTHVDSSSRTQVPAVRPTLTTSLQQTVLRDGTTTEAQQPAEALKTTEATDPSSSTSSAMLGVMGSSLTSSVLALTSGAIAALIL